jgi:hypothetical protein
MAETFDKSCGIIYISKSGISFETEGMGHPDRSVNAEKEYKRL